MNSNELQTSNFDYSLVTEETADFLKSKSFELDGIYSRYSNDVGKILYEAQQELADYNNDGLFSKWVEAKGIKRRNAYNYINIYKFAVQNLHNDQQKEIFSQQPKSLQLEMSKPSANTELNKKVFDGDIKTHKEYKELERKYKQAQSEKEQAKRSEQFAIEQLEREQNKEPKVITETVEKEVVPDDYEELKRMNQSLKREIEFANNKYSMLEASTRSAKELEQKIRSLEDREQSVTQRIEAIERLNHLEEEFEKFFDTKVAPMRFKPITDELYGTNATQRIRQLVETARHWVEEMEAILPQRDIQYAEIIEEE